MKRVRIDFAPPSLARAWHRTGPPGICLAALALLLCAAAGATGWQMLARQRALASQLALVRAHVAVPAVLAVSAPQPAIGAAQADAVNTAVLQLNLPWRDLHDAVAAATPAAIALLALEPDPRRRSIKITAEAKTSDDMIAYVEQLKQQPLFADVALLRHEINATDPNRPIRFQLDAEWSAP
ncbi:MAG: PilN domain-containing protein [Pseudomonadota bacterium]|nr:PilN domain-containing protein [Pseudomonadota bacterium]